MDGPWYFYAWQLQIVAYATKGEKKRWGHKWGMIQYMSVINQKNRKINYSRELREHLWPYVIVVGVKIWKEHDFNKLWTLRLSHTSLGSFLPEYALL